MYIDGQFNGVAPNAKIAFFDLSNGDSGLISLPPEKLYAPGRAAGARIHTNSWGGYYSGQPYYAGATMDNYLFNNPDTLVFFSAGNNGDKVSGPSISTQSSSKNIIVVASGESTLHSNNINNVAYYSSIGPAHDGRIKPDITAPGHAIISAAASGTNSNSCETTEKSGTSMASPAAAGSAALIRQYFMQSKYWSTVCNTSYYYCKEFTPSGVLLKTLILHSGNKMNLFNGNTKITLGLQPDSYQGYGRITLTNILPFPKTPFDLYVSDITNNQLNQNDKKLFYYHLINSGQSLKYYYYY